MLGRAGALCAVADDDAHVHGRAEVGPELLGAVDWCLADHACSIEDSNSDRNVVFAPSSQPHGAIAAARWSRGSLLIAVAAAAAGALPDCWATAKVPK